MAKKVQLSKKINGVVHQIYPKTVYDVVVDKNGKTLLLDIEAINSDLERIEDSIPTKLSDLQGGAEIVTESEINAKLDNYYTKDAVDSKLENIGSGTVDLKNYYTKNEVYNKSQVDDLLDDVQIQDLSEYAKKSEVISEEKVQELIDQAQFPEGGDIDLKNYYTKGEVDIALASKQNTLKDGINIKTINNKSILGSGNLTIDGGGSSIEIITSSDKTTLPSDGNVYSALKVDNEFTRNNEKETIGAQWLFEDKTVFNGNVEFNKTIQKPVKFEDHIQSPDYSGNVLGSGWYLGFDNGTNSHLEVDTLKVRKKAIFDTLEIKHVAHVGGEIMLTPAGAKISKVEAYNGEYGEGYKCFFKASGEDEDGNQLYCQNEFAKNDLVMCKTFNLEDGQQRYYWRKCIRVNYTPDENGYFWIILSEGDADKLGTDYPIAGDVIVTVGNSDSVKNSDRQNAIVISAYSSDAPSICLYQGIGTPDEKNDGNIYSLRDDIMPVRISPKGNKFTGNFIIENKKDVAGSLVQVLESLISFSVTGLSYNELLGVDAVKDEVERSGDHVIYSLNGDIVKTWQQGDNIAIKLRFDELALQNKTNITISLLDGLLGKFDVNNDCENEQTIEAEDLENPVIKLFLKNGNEFDSDTFRIKITGSENCLPYSVEARAGFDTELRRTGIDIENGIITLLAATTRIIDSEGEKSLADFTKDQIDLSVYDDAIDELTGKVDSTSLTLKNGELTIDADKTTIKDSNLTLSQFTKDLANISAYETIYNRIDGADAVTGRIETGPNYKIFYLNKNIINLWKIGDVVDFTLSLTNSLNKTITVLGVNGLLDAITSEDIPNTSLVNNKAQWTKKLSKSISDIANLQNPGIQVSVDTGEIDCTLKAKCSLKLDLKRTGIDIENGTITLDADKTLIVDKENGKTTSIAEFTSGRISLAVQDANQRIDDLTGLVNNTSLILENGKITLDADETTIKDTDLTLALFTRDLASISVYDSIKETLGENAVSNTLEKLNNKIVYSISSEITDKWAYGQDLKLILKFAKTAKDFINSLTITSLFNKILLNNEDINTFIYKDVAWTGRLGQPHLLTLEAEFKSLDVLPRLEDLIETVELRRTIKSGLKRTGIDIENGQITLNADTTVVKDGDDSFNIALFTKNLITLLTESYVNALLGENSYGMAETAMQNSKQVYYREYTLNSEIVSKWKKDEIITMSFIINPIAETGKERNITVIGNEGLAGILDSVSKLYTLETRNIQCSTVCLKDAAHLAGNGDLKLRIFADFPHYLGCLEIHSKLYGQIKNAGIDLNNGTITLNAETTKIKSGEQDIALFTIDDEGMAVISADLIDAKNILAEVLKTKGNEDSNYISIKDNSLSMFNDAKKLKFLLHSGELINITDSTEINISIPNTIVQEKTLSDGLLITDYFDLSAEQNILQIPQFDLLIEKNWPINVGHRLDIDLYAILYSEYPSGINPLVIRSFKIGKYTTYTSNPTSSYTKKITFPNMTLSKGKYKLFMVATFSNGGKVDTTGADILGTVYLNTDIQEIASNGYNFNYSANGTNVYQKGSSEGFEMICGLYGLKIDSSGIYVRGKDISGWKQLDLTKLPFKV